MLRSGQLQTIAGAYLPQAQGVRQGRPHHVELPDGDRLVLHDDLPIGWRSGDRVALLIHGLAGSHQSGYLRRIAAKLVARGIRAIRMDLRGAGAGVALAKMPYHSGRSEDAAAAIEYLAKTLPNSPVTLVGFSLGGNIALKLLGELGEATCGGLDSGMAVCPPIDLEGCSQRLMQRQNRLYDLHFVDLLLRQIRRRESLVPEAARIDLSRRPRSLREFDDRYTAKLCGFGNVENYYRLASSAPLLAEIRRPTMILTAADDPMIPLTPYEVWRRSEFVRLHVSQHGGHLGFVARRSGQATCDGRDAADADRRWMDWRVVDWVMTIEDGADTAK